MRRGGEGVMTKEWEWYGQVLEIERLSCYIHIIAQGTRTFNIN